MGRIGRREGEDADFAAVFDAHRDEVVRLAYLVSGDAELAKDAEAEAFARTYEQWRRGRVENVAGYVRRAVVNRVKNDYRRRGSQRRHERRRRGDERGSVAPDERVADVDAVTRLLRQLPARQRAAVVLRYWGDLPVAEGTVKSLLSRALTRLRDASEGEPVAGGGRR